MAIRDLLSMLPSEWGGFGEQQKIDWFNEQAATPQELLATKAVSQDEINAMLQRGYTGGATPYGPELLAQPYGPEKPYVVEDLIADTTASAPVAVTPTTLPDLSETINPFTGGRFGDVDYTALTQQATATQAKETDVANLASQIASQWQQFGINPDIKGINRANELAQILSNYGISDLSKLGLKQTPYEEMRGGLTGGGAEGGDYVEELYKGNRGQLTYDDKTFGRLGGFGSSGGKEFGTPQEYLTEAGNGRYGLSYSAAGKGWTDYEVVVGPGGKPVIVPKWGSSSDVDAGLIQALSIMAMPFTGGLSAALGGGLAGQIGAQALISGGLGGLSAAAQGEDILKGALRGGVGGALTAGIGSLVAPAASAVGSSVLSATDSQLLADIASGAIKGGAGALPGAIMSGDFGNVLTGAVSGGVGSGVGSALEDLKISDKSSINNAIIQGAGDIAAAATKAAMTGQSFDVVGALTPAIAQGISDEFKLPVKQVTAGLQVASKLLQGGDLSPADILKLGTSLSSSGTKPTAGQAASAGYGGAETEGFFDSEEAQAVEDDIQSILARYPEAAPAPQQVEVSAPAPAPTVQDFIDQITKEEAVYAPEPVIPTPAPPPEQSYEVIAPAPAQTAFDLPEEVLSALSPAPQARPISDLEKALFQEANVMPETPAEQRVEVTGARTPAMPEDFGYEVPTMTEAELQQLVAPAPAPAEEVQRYEATAPAPQYTPEDLEFIQNVVQQEAALPKDETQRYEATGNLPEQTLYELPEAPVVQDLYQPPGQLEGPSTIETTGTKPPEVPVIPLEDVPEVLAPPVEAPTIPAPTPTAPPAPGATTPPAVAPAAPTQAPKKQDDLALLMMLAAMMTPQQKEEEKYQLAQIFGVDSPFGRIV